MRKNVENTNVQTEQTEQKEERGAAGAEGLYKSVYDPDEGKKEEERCLLTRANSRTCVRWHIRVGH